MNYALLVQENYWEKCGIARSVSGKKYFFSICS